MRIDALNTARNVVRSRNHRTVEQHETALTNLLEAFDARYIEGLKARIASAMVIADKAIQALPPESQQAIAEVREYYADIESYLILYATEVKALAGPAKVIAIGEAK